MANSNFKINGSDFDDLYIRRDIFSSGNLWSWGQNNPFAQLGDGTSTSRSSPVQVSTGGTNWRFVSAGGYQSIAIKTDGRLWSWGINNTGGRGVNYTSTNNPPAETVSGGTNWRQAATDKFGMDTSAAVKTDGTLWMWGANNNGQLGDNTRTAKSSPVQTIAGGTNWRQVSSSSSFTAAIKTDGTLWLWGDNTWGQLSTNDNTNRSSPVQTVSGGTNWNQVAVGGSVATAIKTDGTLWTWGYNNYGQLGDNTTTHRSSPVQTIAGGTNWRQVSSGGSFTAAIKTDGTLWFWGDNTYGQLGDNTRTQCSSPIQTISGGTNWRQVSCGRHHAAAIKTDGTLWCWGRNNYGQIGDNTVTHRSSPVQTVAGGTNWRQVDCGQHHTVAITDIY